VEGTWINARTPVGGHSFSLQVREGRVLELGGGHEREGNS
jgi:hypothetical protein